MARIINVLLALDCFLFAVCTLGRSHPFEELTEAKVIEWIKRDSKGMFEEQADAELEAYKLRKAAPVMTSGTPW